MLSLGPFPMTAVWVMMAFAMALGVAVMASRGREGAARSLVSALLDLLMLAVVVARLAFVVRWWPLYAAEPLSIVMIQDGGFLPWVGISAALVFALWRSRARPEMRAPLLAASLLGVLVWWGLGLGLRAYQQRTLVMPDTALVSLQGQPVSLEDFAGQPVVLNLWATWCPPCRREMPVLAAAQAQHPGVHFVFVNQGETGDVVQTYLARAGLSLDNVVLDAEAAMGDAIRTNAIPATLFFDADGALRDTHLGTLTAAGLAAKLQPWRRDLRP